MFQRFIKAGGGGGGGCGLLMQKSRVTSTIMFKRQYVEDPAKNNAWLEAFVIL